jgi:cell filamentation protein
LRPTAIPTPNTSNYPDQTDVLRNLFGFRSHEALRQAEYRLTSNRRVELELGGGPTGTFDAAHLKAIHQYLFSQVYEWAGHTRDERPIVDGLPVEPIGTMRKGGTSFLHGSRIALGLEEALRPISNPDVLKGSTPEEFSRVAGRVLGDLNFVHPFREGNGRTQEAFIAELGRHAGLSIDFSVITKPRMIAASIASTNDPDHPAMRHLVEDAVDPARVRALKAVFEHLTAQGENPYEHDVRAARPGETLSGALLAKSSDTASLITNAGIVAVSASALPKALVAEGEDVRVTVGSRANQMSPESYWSRVAARARPPAQPSASETLRQTETPHLRPRR